MLRGEYVGGAIRRRVQGGVDVCHIFVFDGYRGVRIRGQARQMQWRPTRTSRPVGLGRHASGVHVGAGLCGRNVGRR